jgi:hypothetical protein
MVPLMLKRGRFRAPDKLTASLQRAEYAECLEPRGLCSSALSVVTHHIPELRISAEFIQTGYPAFLQGNRHRVVGVFPTLLSPGAICRLVRWGFLPSSMLDAVY